MRHRVEKDEEESDSDDDGPRTRRRHEPEILDDAKASSGEESDDGII